jgi:hypothetical protein
VVRFSGHDKQRSGAWHIGHIAWHIAQIAWHRKHCKIAWHRKKLEKN